MVEQQLNRDKTETLIIAPGRAMSDIKHHLGDSGLLQKRSLRNLDVTFDEASLT